MIKIALSGKCFILLKLIVFENRQAEKRKFSPKNTERFLIVEMNDNGGRTI
jgi:hypothetical protein